MSDKNRMISYLKILTRNLKTLYIKENKIEDIWLFTLTYNSLRYCVNKRLLKAVSRVHHLIKVKNINNATV